MTCTHARQSLSAKSNLFWELCVNSTSVSADSWVSPSPALDFAPFFSALSCSGLVSKSPARKPLLHLDRLLFLRGDGTVLHSVNYTVGGKNKPAQWQVVLRQRRDIVMLW